MFRVLVFLLLVILFAFQQTCAQAPFAQVNQLPLFFNPSLAGGKEKKRLSLGWNTLNSEQKRASNYAFSYDQVLRKLGSGIGVYYLYQDQKNDKLGENSKSFLPPDVSELPFLTTQRQQLAGLCFAPKYNIYSRSNPSKIRYTFSPSVFVEMGKSNISKVDQFSSQNFNSTLYSVEYPNGATLLDSTVSQMVQYKLDINLLRSGIGLQLNSGKFILLTKIAFERSATKEIIGLKTYNVQTQLERGNQTLSTNVLYAIEPNVHVGYSFSQRPESKFSFTPIVGVGVKHYFNLGIKVDGSSENAVYSLNLTSRQVTAQHYAHASANFRYNKILFGAAITKYFNNTYSGGTLGFQNSWLKLMSNFGVQSSSILTGELTIGILF